MNKQIKNLLKFLYRLLFRTKPIWSGDYATWQEAQAQCTGYDADNILEKVKNAVLKVKNGKAVYERDSVTFDKLEYTEEILSVLQKSIDENNNILDIIDFGGSLGSSYFQYKTLLKNVKQINWNVVEQPHFVDCGNAEIADNQLQFYYTIEECLKNNQPKILLLSSVLQYLEEPYLFLDKFISYNFQYIIIERTAFIDATYDRITVQTVPKKIYKASYPAWFFNEKNLLLYFKERAYKPKLSFDNKKVINESLIGKSRIYWNGFIIQKNNA